MGRGLSLTSLPVSPAARGLAQLIHTAERQTSQLLEKHDQMDAVTTVHQAALALHALADGTTGVEAGLQSALTEILMVMHQLGATLDTHDLEATSEYLCRLYISVC